MAKDNRLILHVDDDEANRYAVTRSLTRAGFDVIEAIDGREALDKLAVNPELVILDIRLPDIDGFEICRRIKANSSTAHIPVLHLSASFVTSEDKAHGLDSGADGYLVRPVEPVELIATVNALLRAKESEEALRAIETTNLELIGHLQQALGERDALLASEQLARADAERAGKMKDEFLATLSHELRTPLTAILGWSALLKVPIVSEDKFREGLRVIERNARAQTQIIDDLLDMSRIASGKISLNLQSLELSTILKTAVETVKQAADAKQISITMHLDPAAEHGFGDANRLHQIICNLLTNAIKFSTKSSVVKLSLHRVDSRIEISVSDTGEGIRLDFLPHVFDRFRQADASTTRSHGGLGLGLAIVKQLVEIQGGHVRAESAGPGQGSTFVVSLPLKAIAKISCDLSDRDEQTATAPVPLRFETAGAGLAGKRVLVVDDEEDTYVMVRYLLEACGAIVITAGSTAEAIVAINRELPDVLITDIGMPNEDGYTLIRRVRELTPERGGLIPAIALTAYARPTDRTRSELSGFQLHLAKPVEPQELLEQVAALARGAASVKAI